MDDLYITFSRRNKNKRASPSIYRVTDVLSAVGKIDFAGFHDFVSFFPSSFSDGLTLTEGRRRPSLPPPQVLDTRLNCSRENKTNPGSYLHQKRTISPLRGKEREGEPVSRPEKIAL